MPIFLGTFCTAKKFLCFLTYNISCLTAAKEMKKNTAWQPHVSISLYMDYLEQSID